MTSPPKAMTIRPTPEDHRIVTALCRKLGGNVSSITRQAWRLLAEKELPQKEKVKP